MKRTSFRCHDCKQVKPIPTDGITTGYGLFGKANHKVCFACCGERDRAYMIKHGKIMLYLSGPNTNTCYVGNWPGTLRFTNVRVRIGFHNIAGHRYDCWFTGPDGKRWHGVTYGDNTQICHCKRMKG